MRYGYFTEIDPETASREELIKALKENQETLSNAWKAAEASQEFYREIIRTFVGGN